MNYKSHNNGFSIIELLIAVALGSILLAGVVKIFINNKGTYRLENELSRLQEHGRFIVDTLIQDIRMADYSGCSSRTRVATTTNKSKAPPPFVFDSANAVQGYNANSTDWTPAVPGNLNISTAISGTDILNIQRAQCSAPLTGSFGGTTPVGIAANNCNFRVNQPVLITDCSNANIFQISAVTGTGTQALSHGTTTNTTASLSQTFGMDASIFRLTSNSYFIANNSDGIPSLFRSSWNPNGDTSITATDFNQIELASGVENMQILYGEDNTGDEYADVYRTANNIGDWSAVRSIRINLLLQSEDNITQDNQIVTFDGVDYGNSDNRLRLAYTTTVNLRNRVQ